ncbi:RNA 3'-phosphate cyclase [Alkalilimnicola ehrlichii]|uniref:RNA 3'-terminal phosphate cyclase n=1 Tax=Alkalilimnicola ehrlichii TaxID=351052 RepID=A0A3E0X1T6_9GAMM|nr:RNA 3'-phosphate cyclase [Alkalilimnicola ehrlichii]RFA39623.1 RNA 3'-phosphate cyclase [Alkalilimnicola ehrlichii]
MRTIEIDGSEGEGGGQILRTSLTLAMLYGLSISLTNIRRNRSKPGLMRQHLACVNAAQAICNAEVSGAELGSQALRFEPGAVAAGNYHFDVGSAGSTTLVFQTVFLPLLNASGASKVRFTGGTHNPMAPPLTFLTAAFLPLLKAMGAKLEIDIERWGYFPAGGGQWVASLSPGPLHPIQITDRGELVHSRVTAYLSNIRHEVAEREIHSYRKMCRLADTTYDIRYPKATCPGNLLSHELQFRNVQLCFAELGKHRLRAERVAENLAHRVSRHLDGDAALCEHLADQIMLPMVAAGGGSFSCGPLSSHAQTNSALIERLTGHRIAREMQGNKQVLTLG